MRHKLTNIVVVIGFIFLITGLFYLQILRGLYYAGKSKNNCIRVTPLDAPRGNIYDRDNKTIASSRLVFNVAAIPQELKDRGAVFDELAPYLDTDPQTLEALYKRRYRAPFAPVILEEDIGKHLALRIEESSATMPGIVVQTRVIRWYPYHEATSALLGHLGEIRQDELKQLKRYGYRIKDMIGRQGVEKLCDAVLRGQAGGIQSEVDSRGRMVRLLGQREPVFGRDVQLTIDADLQAFANQLMEGRKGAVVVMDPYGGEILALVSSPGYNSNYFVAPNSSGYVRRILKDKNFPLLNRAISCTYQPGSVFKIVTAAAALDHKVVLPQTSFDCKGALNLGGRSFHCWKEEGHGAQNITQGLVHSCNVYFYNLGRLSDPDVIARYTHEFGYGRVSGIDLTGEIQGLVPSKKWKRASRGEPWYEGETLNYAIGQGYLLVTPLQVLRMMNVIATRGLLVQPHIIRRIDEAEKKAPRPRKAGISKQTLDMIAEALVRVVQEPDGTGQVARVEGLQIAGKTGTAQNPSGRTHAWFAGFVPVNNPRVSIVVMVEHGGKGGVAAAYIARELMRFMHTKGIL